MVSFCTALQMLITDRMNLFAYDVVEHEDDYLAHHPHRKVQVSGGLGPRQKHNPCAMDSDKSLNKPSKAEYFLSFTALICYLLFFRLYLIKTPELEAAKRL